MQRFTLPRDLYHGKGALEALKSFEGKKAIICVGGGSMKRFGFLDKAEAYLKEAGMEVKLFEGIEPDPSVETVMKGAAAMEEFEPDWIVAIGGGSPIDAAKAMWIKYEYPDITFEDMCKVFAIPKLRRKAHFCAISSTSGTATEVTAFSIITDYQKGIKYPLADFNITPDVAIVDPDLAETMPQKLTAHTGMDAMTHAIEAYVSTANCDFTDPLAIHAIAEAQKAGGIAAFIDAEHAFDSFYAQKLGVDVDNLLISQPDNGEQALEIADSLIRSSAIDIIVIDSVAALTPKAEIEGEMGDSKMGLQARLMSQALRKLTSSISKTKTVCIFINQLRDKIGVVYGNPETTTGGNALKFYASVRIDIRRMSVIKDGEDQLGTRTKVKVVKNKVAPPFKRAEFDIMFGEGISKIGEIIDLGVDYGVIKKAGSWFSYGDRKIGQGRDAVKELLKNDEELRNEIEANVREAMKTKKE